MTVDQSRVKDVLNKIHDAMTQCVNSNGCVITSHKYRYNMLWRQREALAETLDLIQQIDGVQI